VKSAINDQEDESMVQNAKSFAGELLQREERPIVGFFRLSLDPLRTIPKNSRHRGQSRLIYVPPRLLLYRANAIDKATNNQDTTEQ
jgi:hypothetical protein